MIVEVKNLGVSFKDGDNWIPVTEKFSFSLNPGETLGLVGESGCGKSVTASALMGLLPSKTSRVKADTLCIDGKDVLAYTERDWRQIRGKDVSMIFQNPMTALNPLMKSGHQIEESLKLHLQLKGKELKSQAIHWIEKMGISDAERVYSAYPWELSGGLRQRIMIAIALAPKPKLLIADEPTTALDVTVQATILKLLRELQKDLGMSLILITHDLGIVAEMVENVIVAYAGQMVEMGTTSQVLTNPMHPYTQGLIASIPRLQGSKQKIIGIPGTVPPPSLFPKGCRFEPRCLYKKDECKTLQYNFKEENNRFLACPFSSEHDQQN